MLRGTGGPRETTVARLLSPSICAEATALGTNPAIRNVRVRRRTG